MSNPSKPTKRTYFVTGTDTEVGKTRVTVELLKALNRQGLQTLGLKPLAAGADEHEGEWTNEDARALRDAASVTLAYEQVNPVLLKAPMAPHLAAEREQRSLSLRTLEGHCRGTLMMNRYDVALIEGAGGWRVPLNPRESLAGLPKSLNCPVILVVGMRLGCLNHTLLTAEAIQRDGLVLAGWVANCIDPDMAELDANIATLTTLIPAPRLGIVPHMKNERQFPQEMFDLPALTKNTVFI